MPAGTYKFKTGMLKVKAAEGAKTLVSIKGIGLAVIKNKFGKGNVYYFTGRWGVAMYNNSIQKLKHYKPTHDHEQRRLFAAFVKNILKDKVNVEINGLPGKIMVNAYDTDGDFDGKYKRTIHFLDSFDGYESGEIFPLKNQVCKFRQFAKRNNGKCIRVILRGVKKIDYAKMISPDFKQGKEFKAEYSKKT